MRPVYFEQISDCFSRISVPGGWLVRYCEGRDRGETCFVPDPDHSWDLEEWKKENG